MRARLLHPVLAAALAFTTACGGAKPADDSGLATPPPGRAGPPGASADETSARAAWDAALKLRFAGDELASQRAMIQLAATYPDTRYGRAASGNGALMFLGVASLGVMSAVAVPAYLKYIRRAKTAEARMQVEIMTTAVQSYTERECARLGKACAKKLKFPASTLPTPAPPACEHGTSKTRIIDPALWETPTWKALGFSVREPSLFQYQFESSGQGAGAAFTVRVLGDLDCDGTFSAFERTGTLGADGTLELSPGLYEQDADE